MRRCNRVFAWGGAALYLVSACYSGLSDADGADGGGSGANSAGDESGPDDDVPPAGSDSAVLPLRRLHRAEFVYTLSDLLGEPFEPGSSLPSDAIGGHGFAEGGSIATVDARNLLNVAERFGTALAARVAVSYPCDTATVTERGCAEQFVAAFGRRAYRRHLESEEVNELMDLYDAVRTDAQRNHLEAIAAVVEAMIQTPNFLYRRELGSAPPDAAGGIIRATPDEVASRLSYFLWSSLPDDALFEAADIGALSTEAEIEAEARRMLADPRAARTIESFYVQWLEIGNVETLTKDPATFPTAGPGLFESMRNESIEFARNVVLGEGNGSLVTLLTASHTYADADVAEVYGVAPPPVPWGRIELDPTARAGIFTQPSFLSVQAGPAFSNPAKRGVAVYERLLCTHLQPPDDIPEVESPEPGATTREQFEKHRIPACAGCHQFIDPYGFAFENYDAIGRHRTTDQGEPVDASGIVDLGGQSVEFQNAIELMHLLADSSVVHECFARQWFRFAIGRSELDIDADDLDRLYDAFEASDYDIRELMIEITTLPAFTHRSPSQGEMTQ